MTIEKREEIIKAEPSLSITEVSKKLGAIWRGLGAKERKKYQDLAEKDKKRYREE
jgi:high mobility group protein B1